MNRQFLRKVFPQLSVKCFLIGKKNTQSFVQNIDYQRELNKSVEMIELKARRMYLNEAIESN